MEATCCADSGATKHMFPDYATFVSYHKCSNKFVQLSDSTELPIHSYGTAKFSLNRHVVLVCNALHVPDLTDPLYSLRQHCFMEGCSFFSQYDSGAFLLFPSFSIKIDDSVDCLLNFKPIGLAKSKPIEYAEPRLSIPSFHSARPAHIIPSDDSEVSTNPITPPQTTPSNTNKVLSDLDLKTSATQPLSKRLLLSIHHN